MSGEGSILAIDQGTTSSRAVVVDSGLEILARAQQEFPQIYPASGQVEHDPEVIWDTTLGVAQAALEQIHSKNGRVAGIGITNQRETTLIWDRETGLPIHNAIVWQDRRTADVCRELERQGVEGEVQARTGLLLDPYFSATKIAWLLDKVSGARRLADAGRLAFGTVDSFLIWRLTGGRVHATDATNASRTSLFNIHTGQWDEALLDIFGVPPQVLPEVRDCSGDFGQTDAAVLGEALPLRGVAGDQQAATIGQCCFAPGSAKSTYGTGCFVVLNTGDHPVQSRNRLLTTVAYQLNGQITYALEGSIFVAGAAVQWLRDGLGIIETAAETETLARGLESNGGVYLVPAFTGLGAPHWNPDARGALVGLTRASGPAEIARATLESVCYQTWDLLDAMAQDGIQPTEVRVDGGMVANEWLCQFLAEILDICVDRPRIIETTTLGAAYLAGREAGVFGDFQEFSGIWQPDARFEPGALNIDRDLLLAGWHRAVDSVLGMT